MSTESRTLQMLGQFIPIDNAESKEWSKIPGRVVIIGEKRDLKQENAQYSLLLAVNSLSRLFPVITEISINVPDTPLKINMPLFEGSTIHEAIIDFSEITQPKCSIKISEKIDHAEDFYLIIGAAQPDLHPFVSIGSDGWSSTVSTEASDTSFSSNTNPIGAFTAAVIGGMEAFKHIFQKKADILIPRRSAYDIRWRLKKLEGTLTFSAFTYETGSEAHENPALPDEIDLGELFIIGVGAGGGAALYTLSSLKQDITGNLHLIDPDVITSSNMNRYLYSAKEDETKNRKKVDVVHDILTKFSNLSICRYPVSYQDFVKQRHIEKMGVAVSTVDTKQSKTDIQWDLPRVLLDAAVVQTDFYVRRVDLGSSLCLLCLNKPRSSEKTPEELASKIIGIPAEEIIRLRSENAVIEEKHVEIMKELSKMHGFILPSVGERFSDWWLDHCGEISIEKTKERIPLPFATILPGIFIAGEIIKERYFPKNILNNHYFYDMVALPPNGATIYKPVPECILCSKERTLDLFRKKYVSK